MSRLAAALLALAGTVHVILGVAAIAGTGRLEANVREIETSESGGDLYFSLGAWGVILAVAGVLVLASAALLAASNQRGRLLGLLAAFIALAAAFFSLPIFRWPSVATIALLVSAAYVLAYQLRDPETEDGLLD